MSSPEDGYDLNRWAKNDQHRASLKKAVKWTHGDKKLGQQLDKFVEASRTHAQPPTNDRQAFKAARAWLRIYDPTKLPAKDEPRADVRTIQPRAKAKAKAKKATNIAKTNGRKEAPMSDRTEPMNEDEREIVALAKTADHSVLGFPKPGYVAFRSNQKGVLYGIERSLIEAKRHLEGVLKERAEYSARQAANGSG